MSDTFGRFLSDPPDPFQGYYVRLNGVERFVIPAILAATVVGMIDQMLSGDPLDSFTVEVAWGQANRRPDYVVKKEDDHGHAAYSDR